MYGVSNIFCKHRELSACLILKMIAPTSLSHRGTWGTQWSSASHPTIYRVWNANGQVIIPMTQSGKMSPLSRNRLFKCLKMQGKAGEAEYEIICAMATNTCNPSFPRLQIQVLMPCSCMTWDLTCAPLQSPKSFFWGCFTWTTEQYFLFFHFQLPIRTTWISCPKPQTLTGPKWHYSPQLSLWWSQAGFHEESETNNF